MTLRDYQQETVKRMLAEAKRGNASLGVLPTGCHAAGTPILMADGTTQPVEAVSVGDQVMGPDGQPRDVLRLCRGRQQMHKITPTRGGPAFVVNADHVLALHRTPQKRNSKYPSHRAATVFLTVQDYLTRSKWFKHIHKLQRADRLDFGVKPCSPLDGYALGVLLGDGCLSHGSAQFVSPDHEIVSAMNETAHGFGARLSVNGPNRSAPTYTAVTDRGQPNPLLSELRRLGVAPSTSASKRVPDEFLRADADTRSEVLAGLLDTDGHLSNGGFDFVSKSRQLAADVVYLSRSLGLAATEPRAKYVAGYDCAYWRVSVSGCDVGMPATRVTRKRPGPRKINKGNVSGFTIEPAGEGDFYGFTLSGDHLYLTGDFVVHHNSGKSHVAAALAEQFDRALILAHRQELLTQNAAKLKRDVTFACSGLGKPDFSGEIVVASRDTARARKDQLPGFDAIIVDEAHLVSDQRRTGYQRIFTAVRNQNPDAQLFGLTATPWRLGMGHLTDGRTFDTVAHEVAYLDLVQRGFLAPLRPFAPRSGQISTLGLKVQATGDFAQADLSARLGGTSEQIARYVAKALQTRQSALVFCVDVAHVEEMTAALRAAGVPAAGLSQKSKDRAEILAGMKSGEIRAVANCEILTTGFDHPPLDVIALARPTASPILSVQMLGRGTRTHEGKRDCIASGQRVLTDSGWIAIEQVTTDMRVFDGVEFVEHGGVIFKGIQEVMSYGGLTATPDHKVMCADGWQTLEQAAQAGAEIQLPGIDRPPLQQSESHVSQGCCKIGAQVSARDLLRLRTDRVARTVQPAHRESWLRTLWQAFRSACGKADAWGSKVAAAAVRVCQAALHEPKQLSMGALWRGRNPVSVSIAGGYGALGSGQHRFAANPSAPIGPYQQRRTLCSGQPALGIAPTQHGEQQQGKAHGAVPRVPSVSPGNQVCGRNAAQAACKRPDGSGDHRAVSSQISQAQGPVWDILNCGPRHRFVCEGVIAHNCIIMDFAGVIARNGPITDPVIPQPKRAGGPKAAAPTMVCPNCTAILAAAARSCHECDWTAPPPKPALSLVPTGDDPMGEADLQEVESVELHRHTSAAGHPCVKAVWNIAGRKKPLWTFYALGNPKAGQFVRAKFADDLGARAFSVDQALAIEINPPDRVLIGTNKHGYETIIRVERKEQA